MDAPWTGALLAGLLSCGVTTLGIAVISRHEAWGRRNSVRFMSFAAGLLVSVTLLHLVPKALDRSSAGPAWLLTGYFGLYLIDRYLNTHICDDGDPACARRGIVPIIGIGLHSLVDGVIHAVTFQTG